MIGRHDEWRDHLALLAVFQSTPANMARFVGRQAPPFTMLCDPDETLYATYGVEASLAGYLAPINAARLATAAAKGFVPNTVMEGKKTRLPADFLIDEGGVIRDAYYAPVISEHLPYARVEAFLR